MSAQEIIDVYDSAMLSPRPTALYQRAQLSMESRKQAFRAEANQLMRETPLHLPTYNAFLQAEEKVKIEQQKLTPQMTDAELEFAMLAATREANLVLVHARAARERSAERSAASAAQEAYEAQMLIGVPLYTDVDMLTPEGQGTLPATTTGQGQATPYSPDELAAIGRVRLAVMKGMGRILKQTLSTLVTFAEARMVAAGLASQGDIAQSLVVYAAGDEAMNALKNASVGVQRMYTERMADALNQVDPYGGPATQVVYEFSQVAYDAIESLYLVLQLNMRISVHQSVHQTVLDSRAGMKLLVDEPQRLTGDYDMDAPTTGLMIASTAWSEQE